MPVSEQGRFVALFYLTQGSPRDWSPDELDFIRDIAERTRTAVERRRAQQALRELTASLERQVEDRTADLQRSEARLRAIFDSSYQYQGLLTLDGTVVKANTASLSRASGNLEDVIGKPFWETPVVQQARRAWPMRFATPRRGGRGRDGAPGASSRSADRLAVVRLHHAPLARRVTATSSPSCPKRSTSPSGARPRKRCARARSSRPWAS
jgi:PAS domain-containing protein